MRQSLAARWAASLRPSLQTFFLTGGMRETLPLLFGDDGGPIPRRPGTILPCGLIPPFLSTQPVTGHQQTTFWQPEPAS
jgi:hypothetical protein